MTNAKQMSTPVKSKPLTPRQQARLDAKIAAMKAAGIYDYWMGSASQAYIEKMERGEFVTVVAGGQK